MDAPKADYAIQVTPKHSIDEGDNAVLVASRLPNTAWHKAIDGACTLVCPCVPAAQVASSLGWSYALSLVYFFVLFVVGGLLYCGSMIAHQDTDTTLVQLAVLPIARQYLVFLVGPYLAIAGDLKFTSFVEDLGFLFNGSSSHLTPHYFIALDYACDALILISIWIFRSRLRSRGVLNSPSCDGCCCDYCVVTCCASCALWEMVYKTKRRTNAVANNFGTLDTLPARPIA